MIWKISRNGHDQGYSFIKVIPCEKHNRKLGVPLTDSNFNLYIETYDDQNYGINIPFYL